ncbi:Pyrophosphatase PpaX [Marinobacterium sp. xm-g-59]|uniref:HAD family hydrolase n=1 Tax=Marinobacterium sp. xm-g-59 TaxID=2497748 RepID=UPI00156A6B14|nr:HAD hydrolase-like protein [Marinobacterium sp. xm-g-59]NRP95478.1 Pyrophosphatase PpaX [Marinobacterium sp. xm-g-59]
MNLVFDLDGTLICSKRRLYELFCDLSRIKNISYSDYWALKFSGKSNQYILKEQFGFAEPIVQKFVYEWMNLIESDHYLSMDTLISGVSGFLEKSSKEHSLFICTARQSKYQVKKQLAQLSVLSFFQDVLVTEQKHTKAELLQKSNILFSEDDWMFGDTGHDVIAGKRIGIKTCAVLSGFMSEERLKEYSPDLILYDITKTNFL